MIFLNLFITSVTVQLGGKSHEKGCRKLAFACVSAFSWDLTSGGRPKLLVPDAFRGQEDDLAELLRFSPSFCKKCWTIFHICEKITISMM